MSRHHLGYNGRHGKRRRKRLPVEPTPVQPPTREQQVSARQQAANAAMLETMAAEKERAERQAERDWEIARATANDPMTSVPVWHPNSR